MFHRLYITYELIAEQDSEQWKNDGNISSFTHRDLNFI